MRVRGQRQVLGKQTSTLRGAAAIADDPHPCKPDLLTRTAKRLQLAHRGSVTADGVDVGSLGHFGFREGLEHGLPCAIAGVTDRESVLDGGSSTSSCPSWSKRGQSDALYSSN